MASAAPKRSSGASPDATPGAAGAVGAAGAASAGASSACVASSATDSATGSGAGASETSASMTWSWSRSTLSTRMVPSGMPATVSERSARLVSVGEEARPTSMICSTLPKRKSWVSIQRTGEANCQDSSSMRSRRASSLSSMSAALSPSSFPDGASGATASTKSWVSSKGRATRFGM